MGDAWSKRNPVDPAATDESWVIRYGMPKSWVMREALRSVPRDMTWFELGCSAGAHMRVLESLGFSEPLGADLCFDALRKGRSRRVVQADALTLPFADQSIDGLTTSGTLMHLGPELRLTESFLEILRVTRRYLFFMELYSPEGMFLSFGDLLPPAWIYPWDEVLPPFMPEGWGVLYRKRYDLLPTAAGLRAPMLVYLLGRKGI